MHRHIESFIKADTISIKILLFFKDPIKTTCQIPNLGCIGTLSQTGLHSPDASF